jgi:glutathione S-transferase
LRLYSFELSPYAARCRLAIYRKGLDVEIAEPPEGGTAGEAYRAINPIGKVPALVLDDGTVIPESSVIVEYLEDRFPTPALLPRAPEARARARLIARMVEIYLLPALHPLFEQFFAEQRDPARVEAGVTGSRKALDQLEHFTAADGWAAGPDFSLADCALMQVMFAVTGVLAAFGQREPLGGQPRLDGYWRRIQDDPTVARVTAEMKAGLEKLMASRSR